MKNKGPLTEPWKIPPLTVAHLECFMLVSTRCFVLHGKSRIQLKVFLECRFWPWLQITSVMKQKLSGTWCKRYRLHSHCLAPPSNHSLLAATTKLLKRLTWSHIAYLAWCCSMMRPQVYVSGWPVLWSCWKSTSRWVISSCTRCFCCLFCG